MRKDNRVVKLAIIVLALTMIVLILVSGTFAKYTSKTSGQDTATVAKWSITVNGDEIAVIPERTLTFNLFNTIKDSDGTSTETDVKSGKLIAPGTSGDFSLTVKNNSEVNAKYKIDYELVKSDATLPIEFSTNGTTWTTDLASLKLGETNIAMNETSTTTKVQWRWAYEVSDAQDVADTKLGIAAATGTAPTVTVKATITATQVD